MWIVQFVTRAKKWYSFEFQHEDAANRFYNWIREQRNVDSGGVFKK